MDYGSDTGNDMEDGDISDVSSDHSDHEENYANQSFYQANHRCYQLFNRTKNVMHIKTDKTCNNVDQQKIGYEH